MKRSLPLASICAALAFTSQVLAAGQDPSDLFLKAYMAIQTAEKLETNGKTTEALKQYKFAGGVLDQIRSNSPNWQPLVIEYRSKKTSQKIADLQAQTRRDNDFNATPGPGIIEPDLPTDTLPPVPGDLSPAASVESNDTAAADSYTPTRPSGSELEELRRQLSESRLEIARLRQQNQTLTRKNDQGARNLQQALQRADQNRIQVAELRSQLAQAEDRFQASSSNRTTVERDLEAARVTIAKLRSQIDEHLADVDLVEDEAADLAGKVVTSNASAAKATAERDVALKEKGEAVQAREKAVADLDKAKTDQTSSSQLVATATTERDTALKEKDEALQSRDKAVADLDKAKADQTSSNQLAAKASAERDEALNARGALLATVEKAKADQEKAAKLAESNASLTVKLAEAEKQLAVLSGRPAPEEVAQLKQQILDVQSQLASARKQIASEEKAAADLKTQLATQSAASDKALAEAKKTGARPQDLAKIQDENTLLRDIVLRSLQDQIKRNQASQVLLEELAKVEGKSQSLLDQVDVLGNISLKLDDKERDLFTDSELSYFDSSSKTSGLSVELIQQTTPTATAAVAASKAAATGALTANPPPSDVPTSEEQAAAKVANARTALDKGDFSKAERLYSEALELQPENLAALSGLGVTFFRQKNYRDAEDVLQKAVAVGPKDYISRCTLGIVYYHQGKWDAATRVLQDSLSLDPNNPTAYNYLGIAASKKGQSDQAVKELQKAIALNPQYASAYFNLAVVYATARPPAIKPARENYQKATALGAQPDPALEKLIQ
ncbi:MAG TPA: tetratricopeptide repeat protein [Chthoniobacterales bacterium]